jgi:hypothetical protein
LGAYRRIRKSAGDYEMTIARSRLCLVLLVSILWASAQSSFGQAVYYQPVAATALSSDVFALADAIRAGGQFLVLDARALDIRTIATQQELENYKTVVNNFWELRRRYRSERDQMDPSFLDQEEKRHATINRIITGNFEVGVDHSDGLNVMLSGLLAAGASPVFTGDSDRTNVLGSPENVTLSANDLKQIRLSEGKVSGGGMVFTLDPDQLLDPHWTYALQDDRFRRSRKAFEDALDYAMSDLKSDHRIQKENQDRLLKALSELVQEFEAAWPRDRRKLPDDFIFGYLPAKRCLQRLETSTKRLIKSDNPAAFDDAYRLRGKTAADVVRHVMNNALEFAPPEPGGEATYDKLFHSVKAFYMQLVPGALQDVPGAPAPEQGLASAPHSETTNNSRRSGPTGYLSELAMKSVMVRGLQGLPVNITGIGVRGSSGAAINVAGKPTPHGIWAPPLTNGISSVVYDLRKKAASLNLEVGIEDAADNILATRPVFQIYGDRRLLWASQAITRKGYTERCDKLSVEGVKTLELRVICAGDSRGTGTVWVEPQITWK